MIVTHLTASTFYGGPERQMLGLATSLRGAVRSTLLSFAEGGRSATFVDEARRQGFEAQTLDHDTPRLRSAYRELVDRLGGLGAAVLCCHGYKANLLGRMAGRRAGVPVVAIARGWTGENGRVRVYEALDRLGLRWMDRVVCVSEGQAVKVRRAGVAPNRVRVIHNAIDLQRFDRPDPADRARLHGLFPDAPAPGQIVGAAGRLSPEKGFGGFVEAAALVARDDPAVRFVLFGDGPLREAIARRVATLGLERRFLLAGFRGDLDRFVPHLDLMVLPSFTEGLPNVVLEAFAAAVPVVATAVGGTPELVEEGANGFLVPPGDPVALARRIRDVLGCKARRDALGLRGRETVRDHFTFEAQATAYRQLFAELTGRDGATADEADANHGRTCAVTGARSSQ